MMKRTNKGNDRSYPLSESLLQEFFIEELRDIYWAEKHLVKELARMNDAASTGELKDAIGDHIESTKLHVKRLQDVFSFSQTK